MNVWETLPMQGSVIDDFQHPLLNHLNFRECCWTIFRLKSSFSVVSVCLMRDTYAGYYVMLLQTNQRQRKWLQMMVSNPIYLYILNSYLK